MIEAASLGVGVGWQDAGAVRGMKDLQREVQNTARNAQSEFGRMEEGVQKSLGSAFRIEGNPAFRGLKDLQQEVEQSTGGMRDMFARIGQWAKGAFGTIGDLFTSLGQKAKGALGNLGTTLSGFGGGLKNVLGVVGKLAPIAIAGIGMAVSAVGGAAIKVVKDLISLGSEAEEKLGKFNVVFGAQAAAATQQLTAFGAAVNRSKYELQEMAAGVQGTFVPLGFARDEAARMSVTLTKLAVDVGSFNRASTPDVMNAFTSAIQGNYEAVRQYGVTITEAALNTELLAMGIDRGIKGASELEKAQARLNLITKQTADAQGYAASKSGGWTNTMQGLRVAISDAAVDIGRMLLPLRDQFTPVLQRFLDLARGVLPQVVQQVSQMVSAFVAFGDVLGRLDFSTFNSTLQMVGINLASIPWADFFGSVIKSIEMDKLALESFVYEMAMRIEQIKLLLRIGHQEIEQFLDPGKMSADAAKELEHVKSTYADLSMAIANNTTRYLENAEVIRNTDYSQLIEQQQRVNQLNSEATDWWQRHAEAAGSAATEIVTNVADSLSQLWEQVLPEDEAGWAAYLEQMTTAMTDSSSLLSEHSETQLGLIEEYGARRAELVLQEQEVVAALEAAGQEASAGQMSEYFDTMLSALDEQYQTRIDVEAGAMGTLQDLQAGALGSLLQNYQAYAMDAADQNAQYAQNIVDLEQRKGEMVAYMESVYQQQAAALQMAGKTQQLKDLTVAHKAEVTAVLARYNTQISLEKTGQTGLLTNAKKYYLTTLDMMKRALSGMVLSNAAAQKSLLEITASGAGKAAGLWVAYNKALAGESDQAVLEAAINDLQQAFDAIAGSGIDAINSASDAFSNWKADLGGVGDGLDGIGDKLNGIGDSVGGSGGVSEKIIDPMEAAAKTVEGLAQMVDRAIAAFDVLAEYGGPSPGWVTGYRKLLQAVEVMVNLFAATTKRIFDMGLLAKEKREELGNAVDVIGGTLKVISEALKVSQLFEEVEDQTANVSAILDRLTTDIYLMVRKIMAISETFAKLGDDKLRDATRTSGYLVELMKPWSEAVKAVSALANLPATDAGQFIERTVEQMSALALGMVEVGKHVDRSQMRQAAQAADGILGALKPWEPAVKAISAILTTSTGNIGEQTQKLMNDMLLLVETLRFSQRQLDPDVLKDMGKSAGLIVEALKPWETAARAVSVVLAAPAGNIGEQAENLMLNIFTLVQKLVFAQRQFDPAALEGVAKSAGLIIDALKPWEAAAKAVEAITESTWERVGPRAEKLVGQMFNLIRKLSLHSAAVDKAELERLGRLAQPLIDALKPWEAAARAVNAITEGTWERVGPRAEKLVGQMFNLIRKLSLHSANVDRAELDRLGRLAQPLIDALKPWEAAAKAVDAIAGAAVGRIGPAAEMLVNQIFGLTRKLARIAKQIRPEDLAAAAAAAALFVEALKPWEVAAKAVDAISRTTGEKIGPQSERLVMQMFGLARKLARVAGEMKPGQLQEAARVATLFSESLKPWQEAMTVVQALAGFTNTTKIGPQSERLVMQMMGLARKLARVGREVGLADLEFAARVGRLFGDVLEPWNKAITLSNDLRMWRELPDLQERMTRFARIWVDVIADLSKAVSTLSTQGMEAVAAFGRSLTDLMGGLQAALNVVSDFDFEPPDAAMWGNFQRWVQDTFTSFYTWVNAYGIPEPGMPAVPSFDEKGMAAVSLFAQALRDLMGGLEAALGIATDFEFQEPDPTMWAHFQSWVQSVFVSFYEWVNATAPPEPPLPGVPLFGGDGLTAVGTFASALNSLMQGLQAALAIAKDFEFQTPDATQWNNFFTWVTGVFQTFYDDINTRYPNADPATTFAPVAAWGGALGALMGGLQSALAIAKDFEFVEPDTDQWAAFFAWTTTVFTNFETAINTAYPIDDPEATFAPVAAWGGALGSLMGGLQAALGVASGFQFQEPAEDQWAAFFAWTTTVFTNFETAINTAYPIDDPEATFAPVAAWANAFGALMGGLQSAISLVSEFDWQEPPAGQWNDFMAWSLAVLTSFRDAIIEDYPDANAATWAPVVAWSGALTALMQALQAAVTTANQFVFIAPDQLGWANFFNWVFAVFEDFRLRILRDLPENLVEAGQLAAVVALSNAISAIFGALQSALAFFMDLHGPGEAFWTFLGGAQGNPDTSPFAQRMGYIIGAISGTLSAFDTWVVQNAPTWTGNANTLLDKITTVVGILDSAIQLFDFMANTTLPSTADIQLFVAAVLQLFSSFAGELTNLTGEGGIGSHVNAIATTVSGFVATTMPPQILDWTQAGSDLVGGFASGMASKIGPATVTGTVRHAIAAIQSELGEFTGWWAGPGGGGSNAGDGWYYWYNAGDELVDAFILGMQSNLGNPEGAVYNAAFAIGQAANAGLEAGAASGGGSGGNYRPEGPMAGLGKTAAGTFGWSSPSVASERKVDVTIRFENAPANLDRRTLDELKRTLVYEIRRGA